MRALSLTLLLLFGFGTPASAQSPPPPSPSMAPSTVSPPPPAELPAAKDKSAPSLAAPGVVSIGDGSTLFRTSDGRLLLERPARRDRPRLWLTGALLLSVTYSLSAAVGDYFIAVGGPPWLTIPIAGPVLMAVDFHGGPAETTFLALDTALQAGGLALLLIGAFGGPRWVERVPVVLTPVPMQNGAGIGVIGFL